MSFNGNYLLDLDGRGRFFFPEPWAKELGKSVYFYEYGERIIKAVKEEDFEKSVSGDSFGGVEEFNFIKNALATAQRLESDSKGRFFLPSALGFSGIKTLYAVGKGGFILLFADERDCEEFKRRNGENE